MKKKIPSISELRKYEKLRVRKLLGQFSMQGGGWGGILSLLKIRISNAGPK